MSNQPTCKCTLCGVELFASEVRVLEVRGKGQHLKTYAVCVDQQACDARRKARATEATPQPGANAPNTGEGDAA